MIKQRCQWCSDDPLYIDYHDKEWGVPVHDDQRLFEFIILEGAQAGLSWITVLKKREAYRKHFSDFDAQKIARFTDKKLEKMLLDPGLIRNRLKIYGCRKNARAFLAVQKEFGSFDDYLWGFVDHKVIINYHQTSSQNPTHTLISDRLSQDLKKRGFTFVGSTICYALMQAVGLVNDHSTSCFRYNELK